MLRPPWLAVVPRLRDEGGCPPTSNLRPSALAGVLLHVDGKRDRRRSEVMLMVRIDDPTRKEIPFAGFHLAQSWQPWHPLGGQGRLRVAVWHRTRRPHLPLLTQAATRSEP